MKQTKHEYAIEKIQELTEEYNLPKLCCLFCVYAKFKQVGVLDYTNELPSSYYRSYKPNKPFYPRNQIIHYIPFDCIKTSDMDHNLWLFHELGEINEYNPKICLTWKKKYNRTLYYIESTCYTSNSFQCIYFLSKFSQTQIQTQNLKLVSREMSDFLKKAPKIQIPNNPLKLGVLL